MVFFRPNGKYLTFWRVWALGLARKPLQTICTSSLFISTWESFFLGMICLLRCSRGTSGCLLCFYTAYLGHRGAKGLAFLFTVLTLGSIIVLVQSYNPAVVFGITPEGQTCFLSSPLPRAPSAACFAVVRPSPWLGLCWRFLLHPASYPSRAPEQKSDSWKFCIRLPACLFSTH